MDLTQVQRPAPFGRLGRLRVRTLAVEQIFPFIRIAHRLSGTLNIHERIIFDHEFVLILKGHGTLSAGQTSTPFCAGTLLFIRPFVPHAFASGESSCEHIAVHFDFKHDAVAGESDPTGRTPYEVRLAGGLVIPSAQACPKGGVTSDAFVQLVQARSRAGATSPLEERAWLMQVLAKVMSPAAPSPAPTGRKPLHRDQVRITRAIRHLTDHLTDPLCLETLAEVSGLSPSQFTRLFRRHTGYSPMLYLRRTRVQRARELLEDADLSVKEVARRCGFDDAYHFSRVFHQTDGLPPSLYRESVLEGRSGSH